jgi:hypothetical protein
MTTFSCEEVEARIDLYAAGALEADEEAAVAAHVRHCPGCERVLDEARVTVGLLDLHLQLPEALERLQARLEEDARPPVRVWRLSRLRTVVQRFSSVAALLLITLGLWTLFPAVPRPQTGGELAALVEPAPVRVMVPAGKPMENLASGFKSKRLILEMPAPRAADPLGPPPVVNLQLTLRNDTSEPISYRPDPEILLDLRGPGVMRKPAPERPPTAPAKAQTIPPGQSATIPIHRLLSTEGGHPEYLYWTEPGIYTLSLRARVRIARGGRPEHEEMLFAPPVEIRVGSPAGQ